MFIYYFALRFLSNFIAIFQSVFSETLSPFSKIQPNQKATLICIWVSKPFTNRHCFQESTHYVDVESKICYYWPKTNQTHLHCRSQNHNIRPHFHFFPVFPFSSIYPNIIILLTMSTTPKKDVIHILQYNQIKGTKSGTVAESEWNQDNTQFHYDTQVANSTNNNVYRAAIVDEKTGNIVEWREVNLMKVSSKIKGQSATGETTAQGWSIQYKKKLAEEFGTSKSKRKINQMLSNTISS